MKTALVEALGSALERRSSRESIEAVHRVMTGGLREIDPQAEIRQTGYFNHSWAPDFVLRWPDGGEERHVFLRFSVFHPEFRRELDYLGDAPSVFIGLETEPQSRQVDLGVAVSDVSTAPLVTETRAIGRMAAAAESERETRPATREVIRGGVGVVDETAAGEILSSFREALALIRDTPDPAALRSVLDSLETAFAREASLRIERLLRSRWIGAGARAELFPGLVPWDLATAEVGELADLVEALLDQPDEPDANTWAEIASYVGADRLGTELRRRGRRWGGRVNSLVRAASATWTAQWAYSPQLPSDTFDGVFDWQIANYGFGLHLVNRDAFFSDDGRRFSQVPRSEELPAVAARLEVLDDDAVQGLGLVTMDETVSITLRESASHSIRQLLDDLVQQESMTWRAARISSMVVQLASWDAEVSFDFRRDVAAASRPLPLRLYAELVARYMAALPSNEVAALRSTLAPGSDGIG